MNKIEREKLRREIHGALGGNGWAFSSYEYDELNACTDRLNMVVDLFGKWRNAEIVDSRAFTECRCANPSYPLGNCSNCGGSVPLS